MRLVVRVVGSVPRGFAVFVERVLSGFYSSLDEGSLPELVEVYIYGSRMEKLSFLEYEARELGVAAIGDFATLHEAWRGWPRIHVDYEACSGLEKRFVEALLVHEAGHSVLHGSPLFYTIAIDRAVIEELGIDQGLRVLYLCSTAIKDLEVHRLLYSASFAKQLRSYGEFVARQIAELRCCSYVDIAQLAKLLTPCVVLEELCPTLMNSLDPSCKCGNLAEAVLKALRNLECSDLDTCVSKLARTIIQLGKAMDTLC